jgi:hypothetical protein
VTSEATAVDVALRVAAAVESVGGTYFIGGSLASSIQGEPRATNDVDIVLELPLGTVTAYVAALGPELDQRYVDRWAKELDVADLVEKARRDAAESD